MAREIAIREQAIRLGQLLKLAGVVDSGSEVKELLASRPADVNGEPETRRGRQLHDGDTVRVGEHELIVVAPSPSAAADPARADPAAAESSARPASGR